MRTIPFSKDIQLLHQTLEDIQFYRLNLMRDILQRISPTELSHYIRLQLESEDNNHYDSIWRLVKYLNFFKNESFLKNLINDEQFDTEILSNFYYFSFVEIFYTYNPQEVFPLQLFTSCWWWSLQSATCLRILNQSPIIAQDFLLGNNLIFHLDEHDFIHFIDKHIDGIGQMVQFLELFSKEQISDFLSGKGLAVTYLQGIHGGELSEKLTEAFLEVQMKAINSEQDQLLKIIQQMEIRNEKLVIKKEKGKIVHDVDRIIPLVLEIEKTVDPIATIQKLRDLGMFLVPKEDIIVENCIHNTVIRSLFEREWKMKFFKEGAN